MTTFEAREMLAAAGKVSVGRCEQRRPRSARSRTRAAGALTDGHKEAVPVVPPRPTASPSWASRCGVCAPQLAVHRLTPAAFSKSG